MLYGYKRCLQLNIITHTENHVLKKRKKKKEKELVFAPFNNLVGMGSLTSLKIYMPHSKITMGSAYQNQNSFPNL